MKKAIALLVAILILAALPVAAVGAAEITVTEAAGGKVTYTLLLNTLTLKAIPDKGYEVDEIYIIGEAGVFSAPIAFLDASDLVNDEYTITLDPKYTAVTISPFFKESQITVIPGDMDGDGSVTVTDALAALRIAAKLASPTEKDLAIGDMDNDKSITVTDALSILRIAAKLV